MQDNPVITQQRTIDRSSPPLLRPKRMETRRVRRRSGISGRRESSRGKTRAISITSNQLRWTLASKKPKGPNTNQTHNLRKKLKWNWRALSSLLKSSKESLETSLLNRIPLSMKAKVWWRARYTAPTTYYCVSIVSSSLRKSRAIHQKENTREINKNIHSLESTLSQSSWESTMRSAVWRQWCTARFQRIRSWDATSSAFRRST